MDDEAKAARGLQSPAPEAAAAADGSATRRSRRLISIVGAIALIAIIAGVAFAVYQINRARALAEAYGQAQALYASGDYQKAAEAFGELGDYEDAAVMAQRASLWTAAQVAEEEAGEDPAAWEDIEATYELIGDAKALEAAEACRMTARYYTAKGLMAKKDWAGAQDILDTLAHENFKDASDLERECSAWLSLERADALLAEKRYYEAYVEYRSIDHASYDGMPDTEEKARSCVRRFPAAGVVYSNSRYSSAEAELTIDNAGFTNAYYKFYIGDDLVRTVFIPEGGSVTFSLPAGTYRMNRGYGELWFGTDDMFGDEGTYYRCGFGGSETFELEAGWTYEITSDGEGTSIGTSPSDRASI